MNIKEFVQEMAVRVEEAMGYGYVVNTAEIPKTNGIIMHGLKIIKKKVNLSPCIYLESYYEKFERGEMEVDEIVEDIMKVYKENALEIKCDTSNFTDYYSVRTKLRGRLINTEKNAELLKSLPHREFLDLSLIYSVDYSLGNGESIGSIRVTKLHAHMWGVSEVELYQQVKENMEKYDESSLESMGKVLSELVGVDESIFANQELIPMYILTNKTRLNGAVQMINERILKSASEIKEKDLIILPSSVHEVLLLPVNDNMPDVDSLLQMVQEVNDTQLALNEILSYHVYHYNCQTGAITIAA